MFRVYCRGLELEYHQMQKTAGLLAQTIDSLESAISKLSDFSDMEEIRFTLMDQRNRLEENVQKVVGLLQALERIRMTYLNAERKVCDNAEGMAFLVKEMETRMVEMIFSHVEGKPPVMTMEE